MHSKSMADEEKNALLGLDFGPDIRASDWFFMKKLIVDVQVELTRKHTKYAFMILSRWLTSYEMMQTYEDEVVINGNPTQSEMSYFRACLAHIKANGIAVLSLLEHLQYAPEETTGISCRDINAMIEEMSMREGVYENEKLPEKREEELAKIFGNGSKEQRGSA